MIFTWIPIGFGFTWHGLRYKPEHGLLRGVHCGLEKSHPTEKQSQSSNWAHWRWTEMSIFRVYRNYTTFLQKANNRRLKIFQKGSPHPVHADFAVISTPCQHFSFTACGSFRCMTASLIISVPIMVEMRPGPGVTKSQPFSKLADDDDAVMYLCT